MRIAFYRWPRFTFCLQVPHRAVVQSRESISAIRDVMPSAASKSSKRKDKVQQRTLPVQRTPAAKGLLAFLTGRPWLLAIILALVTAVVYLPVHRHPFFTMDDEQYVVNNARIHGGMSWDMMRWAFTTYDLANWHPVTWLSHAADVEFFRLDPSGHHDVNLLLHVIDALLLFWVLQRATGYGGRSFMVAALFALHPINVETVAWIAERKNVLSMVFFLLALGAYRWYTARPQVSRYLVVTVLYALGLMAKPQIITFPFVLLLWDYWPLRRMFSSDQPSGGAAHAKKFSRLVLEKVPLLALSAGSAIMTLKAQRAAGAMRYYPFSARLENALVSYVRYLGKALWPSRLAVFYTHPQLGAWQVLGALLLLLSITALVLYRKQQRYLATGWFWFLGTLVPMIGVVQVGEQAMADRYAYLSFIGLFLMICWGLAEWAEQKQLSPAWLATASVAVLLALSALTYRQVGYWKDNVTLWSRMAEITDGSYEVEENLGVALLEDQQPAQAMQHFRRVTALVPPPGQAIGRELAGYAAVANLYLGAYDQQHGQLQDAITHYQNVLTLEHQFAVQNVYTNLPPVLTRMKAAALGNMGDAYYSLRNWSDAKTSYQAALQLDPRSVRQWLGLGVVEYELGDPAAAAEAFSRANHLQVSDVGYMLLARALEKGGRQAEADAAREQAKLISPNVDAAQQTADNLLSH